MNAAKYLAVILTVTLLSACSTASKKSEPTVSAESLIAQDFVNTMVQVEALSPWSTVLQFNSVDSGDLKVATKSIKTTKNFGKALRVAAANSGYGLQTVDGVRGSNFVRFSVTEINDPTAGIAFTYDVSVGDVDFRRMYKTMVDGGVEPHKGMLVRGADVSDIRSDDSIFYQRPSGSQTAPLVAEQRAVEPTQPERDGFNSPLARKDLSPKPSTGMPEPDIAVTSPTIDPPKLIARRQADNQGSVQSQPLQPQPVVVASNDNQSMPFDNNGYAIVRKRNIAESGTSNYESLLATKQNVAEEVLIFGDDSYVLGPRNKKILGEVMGSFDPATDVINIVGCSTGTTKIANGNAALAIGRANRVKEALLYSGIPHDKILDEGCWSSEANSTPFPNRGVVITVKRGVKKG